MCKDGSITLRLSLDKEVAEVPVQVNGKLRSRIRVPAGASKDVLERAARDDAGPASQEGLVELCRGDPKMLNAIEPFLTDEQVEMLMNEVTDEPDDEAV